MVGLGNASYAHCELSMFTAMLLMVSVTLAEHLFP